MSRHSLTDEQQLVLDQFAEITDYDPDTELDKVIALLKVCNWSLETAISRYFDNDFPQLFNDTVNDTVNDASDNAAMESANRTEMPDIEAFLNSQMHSLLNDVSGNSSGASGSGGNNIDFNIPSNTIRPPPLVIDPFTLPDTRSLPKLYRALPISNKWKFKVGLLEKAKDSASSSFLHNSKLITPIVFILLLMPKVLLLIGYGLNKLLGGFAPKLFRFLGLREEEDDYPAKPFYNTIEDIEKYDLNKYFKLKENSEKDLKIPIYNQDFNTCFEFARNNLKWLCIILFNSKSSSSSKISKLVTNNEFSDFIEKNDIVLYVGDISYPEPFEVGETYQGFGLPYLSMIAKVSATGLTFPEFSIVYKMNKFINLITDSDNNISVNKLLKKLNRIINKYEPQLITQRYDKQEADLSRIIREQQDEAYQQSLLKDMERENEKKRKQEIENEIKLKEEHEEFLKLCEVNKRKEYIIKYIQKNFSRDTSNWEKGKFTTIQFRNHTGDRFINKFKCDETVNDLFMFVESKKLINELLTNDNNEEYTNEGDVLSYLKDYKFEFPDVHEEIEFSFDLISPMPRLKLKSSNEKISEIKAIWPNGSLLIENIDNDDDEDDDEDDDDEDDDNDDEEIEDI